MKDEASEVFAWKIVEISLTKQCRENDTKLIADLMSKKIYVKIF